MKDGVRPEEIAAIKTVPPAKPLEYASVIKNNIIYTIIKIVPYTTLISCFLSNSFLPIKIDVKPLISQI